MPLTATDRQLEEAILYLLQMRGRGASICPSEAARRIRPPHEDNYWHELMTRTRNAARRLAARKRILVTQRGRPVDPSTAKGAIRLVRAQSGKMSSKKV